MSSVRTPSWKCIGALTGALICGCSQPHHSDPRVPALEYTTRVRRDLSATAEPQTVGSFGNMQAQRLKPALAEDQRRAQLRLASGELPPEIEAPMQKLQVPGDGAVDPQFQVEESTAPLIRDYRGPLNLGDPGVSSSLWKESRGGNDFFRDYRAWQPMDLVTIVVSEVSEGKKEADTSVQQDSTISASIQRFFGVETWDALLKNNIDPSQPLISANSAHDWEGEGETTRKGSLRARISAMVVEVLPSGILRIEGEKIISVNNEDEVMVISGLVRPEDISSTNEVDSSKVGNVRIDYYGRGTVGDAQTGGWLGNIIRRIWPF